MGNVLMSNFDFCYLPKMFKIWRVLNGNEKCTTKNYYDYFFFWRNDQTRGWGQNFLQETAS